MLKWLNKKFSSVQTDKFSKYLDIDGWLTPAEAAGLYEMGKTLNKNAVVLEIGSWKGKSTYCIAQGLHSGVINCIDPFNADGETGSKEIYEKSKGEKSLLEQFICNLSAIPALVKIKTLKGYSSEFVNAVNNVDLLFIDGDHSIEGCKFDFENFSQNVNGGGYLAFHDYDANRQDLGPTWVIDNLVRSDSLYNFYKRFDSLMVFKKIM